MSKGKIIVTGGMGYIGSHTVVELIKAGYEPIIIDDLSNSRYETLDYIEKITGVRPEFYLSACRFLETCKIKYDAVIHFAANKYVGESVKDPLKYYENNIRSMVTVLNYANRNNIPLIFSSSCTVYGEPDKENIPVNEKTPKKLSKSPYGKTKQICEEMIFDSRKLQQTIILRYFNPIGAHPSGMLGENPLRGKAENIMPLLLKTAETEGTTFKVFGGNYNTPDGTCVRDYIDINDLAKAHVMALDRLIEKKNTEYIETFNLGSGTGLSVLELIKAFEEANGITIPYEIDDRRDGDVEAIWANTEKAEKILGWHPETPLVETMRNIWKWENNKEKDNR